MGDRESSRRKFLTVVPTAVAGALAARAYAQGPAAGPINADIIKAAQALDGITLTSEEAAQAFYAAVERATRATGGTLRG